MKQIVATALVAFIGIIVLAQEAQLSGVHLVGGHRQNSTNNSTHNSTHNNNSAVLDAVLRNLSHVQAQLNQLTLVVRQLQNSTHNNSTHNNSTGSNNSTLIPGHNSTIVSGGNFTQLLNISLQNSRQLNSLQNSVNYLTGLLVNLTQHLNITAGNGNGNGIHLHPLQNSTHHNSTHNRTNANGHHFKFNQFFLN